VIDRVIVLVVMFACFTFAPTRFSRGEEGQSRNAGKYRPKLSDFRLDGNKIIPEIDSSNIPIFSGSTSVIPGQLGVDRFTAPPFAIVMQQKITIRDLKTGVVILGGEPSGGFRKTAKDKNVWEPGSWTSETQGWPISLRTEVIALSRYQGYIFKVTIKNQSKKTGHFVIASGQQPSIVAPLEWSWNAAFKRTIATPVVTQTKDVVVHGNKSGVVAIAMRGASVQAFDSPTNAKTSFDSKGSSSENAPKLASVLSVHLSVAPGEKKSISIIVLSAKDRQTAVREANELATNPAKALQQAHNSAQSSLERWFENLPSVSSSSPQLVKFYHQAAVQLLYDRWKVGKTFLLDPWYPTSGLDSGAMNAYAWDIQYGALAFSFLDPHSFRNLLTALPAAPLTEHFSIEPIQGNGIGTYYAYNSYSYINSVTQYISVTGDRSLLQEEVRGKTVLEWMIALAEWGEKDRDLDGNHLLDYGDDHNLLELKKTENGPGYCNEVPSPNGERVYNYQTVADFMEQVDPQRYREKVYHFRIMAKMVAEALNSVLWLEKEGWYGTRQRDGSVVPIYSIQVFDLLRIPGLVPEDRAKKLIAHLNTDEFVAPWGIRSMSAKDRLFDYNDHDWAGAMSYAGDGPQLSTDLFTAGFIPEGWLALEKILWWPDHMAVYPQGIANDSYAFRVPAAVPFGGRVTAGRANIIAGVAGVETVLRGIFGLELGEDGSIGFSNNRPASVTSLTLSLPHDGRVWTVRLAAEKLNISSNNGFATTFFRADGSLRIKLRQESVTLSMRSRSSGIGRLTLDLQGLQHLLHVRELGQLVFRRNGVRIQPKLDARQATIETKTSPDESEQIEILAESVI